MTAVCAVIVLAGWEIGVHTGRIGTLYFPAPSTTVATLATLATGGELAWHSAATIARVLSGFVLGAIPGVTLGLFMGWRPGLRRAVDPLIAAFHPLPKLALFPLIVILFGIGETATVILVALGSFFPLLISTMSGVRQIAPVYFEVAENYGASPLMRFTDVVVPGSLPAILTGVRLSLNTALLLTIASELLMADVGLGSVMWMARETLRTEELYAALVVTGTLGLTLSAGVRWLSATLAPWQQEREG